MMFSEFQQGTGCRDNEYNHKVYRDLEVMYMNDDSITKEQVYEYGKKLVDNSDTPEQVELKAHIKAEIDERKMNISAYKNEIEFQQEMMEYDKSIYDNESVKERRRKIRAMKDGIKNERIIIRSLKWVIGG